MGVVKFNTDRHHFSLNFDGKSSKSEDVEDDEDDGDCNTWIENDEIKEEMKDGKSFK